MNALTSSFIQCKCNEVYDESNFLSHFPSCSTFKKTFGNFDKKFAEILHEYETPKENLLIIKILLNQYVKIIESKIIQLRVYIPEPKVSVLRKEESINVCQLCYDPNFNYLDCCHPICTECIFKLADVNFSCMKCNNCQEEISSDFKMQVMGKEKFEEYECKSLNSIFKTENVKTCINEKCKESFVFEPGNVDLNRSEEHTSELQSL